MKDNKHRSRLETPAPWRQVDMFIFNHYSIFVDSPSSNLIPTYIWYVVVVVLADASFPMVVTRWWTFLNVISQNEMQKVWNSWNSFGHIFYKGLWQKVQTPSKWQWQLQFRFELIKFYWKQEKPHSFDMCNVHEYSSKLKEVDAILEVMIWWLKIPEPEQQKKRSSTSWNGPWATAPSDFSLWSVLFVGQTRLLGCGATTTPSNDTYWIQMPQHFPHCLLRYRGPLLKLALDVVYFWVAYE